MIKNLGANRDGTLFLVVHWIGSGNSQDEFLLVTRIERIRGGEREMEARFSDFVHIGGSYYPRSVVMEGEKARLTLQYQEFVINEELDESLFHLALPGVVEIIPW